jgi:hypothetical protein
MDRRKSLFVNLGEVETDAVLREHVGALLQRKPVLATAEVLHRGADSPEMLASAVAAHLGTRMPYRLRPSRQVFIVTTSHPAPLADVRRPGLSRGAPVGARHARPRHLRHVRPGWLSQIGAAMGVGMGPPGFEPGTDGL